MPSKLVRIKQPSRRNDWRQCYFPARSRRRSVSNLPGRTPSATGGLGALGEQNRSVRSHNYRRTADYFVVSTTDPAATDMQTKGGVDVGYHTHYVVDGCKRRIILQVLVTPAEVTSGLFWAAFWPLLAPL